MALRQLDALGVGAKKSARHHLLHFCAGPVLEVPGDLCDGVGGRVAAATPKMNRKNLSALGDGREIHEEYFVEATAPYELGRELIDLVCGRRDEDRSTPLLEPGKKGTEYPRVSPIAAAPEALLDL